MEVTARQKIIDHARRMFAERGSGGLGMRELAVAAGISPSVIYHYFADKDVLLRSIFDADSKQLGIDRAELPALPTARESLTQRINFQFDHAEKIVYILKYFMQYRHTFAKQPAGYVPPTAYLHIKEVLQQGLATGEYAPMDVDAQAKIIAHAINGFVLEYFPDAPAGSERAAVVAGLESFITKSLEQRKGGTM
jgi:AcrR family transcriptional regulator